MPADDSLDQQRLSLQVLNARYPSWTIWYGEATERWWALPPHGRPGDELVEARNVEELVESIETTRARWPSRAATDTTR